MSRLPLQFSHAFHALEQCHDPFVFTEGARGTLKTVSELDILMLRGYEYPGLTWCIWRSTRALLSTTVLDSFEKYVIPRWANVRGMKLMNPAARPMQRSEYIFENGTIIRPIGMDDTLRGTSAEAAGGYVAEALELENVDQVTALSGMMRQPGIPFHTIMVDANPGAPGHWTNQTAEPVDDLLRDLPLDPAQLRQDRRGIAVYRAVQEHNRRAALNPARRWKRIITSIVDNPFFFDVATWSLTVAGQAYLLALQTLSGHLFQRWVRGIWAAATGTVFPEFNEARNKIKAFAVPPAWPVWMLIDPGYNHPCGVSWNTISPSGKRYTIAEIKGREIDLDKLVDQIQRKGIRTTRNFLDPRGGNQRKQESGGKNFQQLLREKGIYADFWPMVQGRALEASVEFHRQEVKSGNYVIFDTCPETISEHQNWKYKTVRGGVLPVGDDAFEDANNDILDGVMGWERTKPEFPKPPPPPATPVPMECSQVPAQLMA